MQSQDRTGKEWQEGTRPSPVGIHRSDTVVSDNGADLFKTIYNDMWVLCHASEAILIH